MFSQEKLTAALALSEGDDYLVASSESPPMQLEELASLLKWTHSVEQAVQATDPRSSLTLLHQRAHTTIRTLHCMLHCVAASGRTRLRRAILRAVGERDATEGLASELPLLSEGERASAWAWTRLMRGYQGEMEGGEVHLHQGLATIRYGFEYNTCNHRLVVPSVSERFNLALIAAVGVGMMGVLHGSSAGFHSEIVYELAHLAGQWLFHMRGTERLPRASLTRALCSTAGGGGWLLLSSLHSLPYATLQELGQSMHEVRSMLLARNDKASLGGAEVSLLPSHSRSFAAFATMDISFELRELPNALRIELRPCGVVRPDERLVCEALLLAAGFTCAADISRRVCLFDKLVRSNALVTQAPPPTLTSSAVCNHLLPSTPTRLPSKHPSSHHFSFLLLPPQPSPPPLNPSPFPASPLSSSRRTPLLFPPHSSPLSASPLSSPGLTPLLSQSHLSAIHATSPFSPVLIPVHSSPHPPLP